MVGDVPEAGGRDAVTDPILIRHRLTVRFSDCDPLGHANNAVYLTYLEQARLLLWRGQFGFSSRPPAEGRRRGTNFILARAEIDFRAQAFDTDELEVRMRLAGFGRSTATYDYEIVEVASGRTIATARTVQVWFDYDENRSVPLEEDFKAVLRRPIA
jgi:acyl-CoA thioester hydrolase